jgi:hypothetical protein
MKTKSGRRQHRALHAQPVGLRCSSSTATGAAVAMPHRRLSTSRTTCLAARDCSTRFSSSVYSNSSRLLSATMVAEAFAPAVAAGTLMAVTGAGHKLC